MKIKTLEIAGFYSSLKAMRLPMRSKSDSTWSWCPYPLIDSVKNAIGEKDLELAQKLIHAGDEHAKFSRGIQVWAEITGPWYFFNELDTYVVGSSPIGSTSSMHSEAKGLTGEALQACKAALKGDYEYTRIRLFSYQCLRRIFFQRRSHRLPEWHLFCDWILTLPLAKELITIE